MFDKRSLTIAAGAVLLLVVAMPAQSSDLKCGFRASGLSLNFGTLNPASGATVTVPMAAATLNADKVGDCTLPMTLSADNGLWFSRNHRLKNTGSADYIPYTLAGLPQTLPAPGNKVYVSFTFSGTVLGSDYANAPAGNYSDTVMISVTP